MGLRRAIRRCVAVGMTLVIAAFSQTLNPEPAEAFWTDGWYGPTNGTIAYRIDGSVYSLGPDPWRAIHKADQEWWPLRQSARFSVVDSGGAPTNRYIDAFDMRNTQNALSGAWSNLGCWGPNNCEIHINSRPEFLWDVDDDPYVGAGRLDMWSFVGHEFGHWIGIHHPCGPCASGPIWNNPSTHPTDPVMKPNMSAGQAYRTITQDDSNGFWSARMEYSNGVIANSSFETGGPFYGWATNNPGGGSGAACGFGAPWDGSCFWKMIGGGGTSVYQDLEPRGARFPNGKQWTLIARVRSATTQTVEVVIWSLNNPGGKQTTTCSIPGNSQWTFCQLGPIAPYNNDTRFRIEFYKGGAGDMDIDVPSFY